MGRYQLCWVMRRSSSEQAYLEGQPQIPVVGLAGLVAALLTWTRPGATDGTATDPVVIQVLDNAWNKDVR